MAKLKRPRGPNQLAKLMVDVATGDVQEPEETERAKRARKAGKHGGAARAAKFTPEQLGFRPTRCKCSLEEELGNLYQEDFRIGARLAKARVAARVS